MDQGFSVGGASMQVPRFSFNSYKGGKVSETIHKN